MQPSRVTILAYHRIATGVDTATELTPTLIDAYPEAFEAQMRYVASRYNVISSWDLVRALTEAYTLPRRALVITFDDGYRCFQDTAMPVLRRLGLPVTLFVATHYTSSPGALFWWDAIYRALAQTRQPQIEVQRLGALPLATRQERLAAFERLTPLVEQTDEREASRLIDDILESCAVSANSKRALLDWGEVEALHAEGVAVGPHTRHHTILAQAAPDKVKAEVAGSWADLEGRLSNPLPVFCYPNGQPYAINRVAVEAVRRTGLAAAYTLVAGGNVVGRTNPYLLHRLGAVAGESLPRFVLKITAAGRLYRRLKSLAARKPVPRFDL